jgi:cytochrome c oxidase assembly protein subunit 15
MDSSRPRRFIHFFAVFTAASTLWLIFMGALVKSHEAGLSVPDWPNTYGQFMFSFPFDMWRANIFYEHSHRLVASFVGFLILVQAFVLHFKTDKPYLKKLGWAALGAVILQGVLGGLTVIFLLPTWISTSHATLAQITLCLTTAIALVTSKSWAPAESPAYDERKHNALRTFSKYVIAAIFVQLILGALMRHEEAGLAIPTFPLSNGNLLPDFISFGVVLNFLHRTWAFVVAIMIFVLNIRALRTSAKVLRTPALLGMLLVLVQITLGAITIWSGKEPNWTSLHVVNGAAVLMTEFIVSMRVNYCLCSSHSEEEADERVTYQQIAAA